MQYFRKYSENQKKSLRALDTLWITGIIRFVPISNIWFIG